MNVSTPSRLGPTVVTPNSDSAFTPQVVGWELVQLLGGGGMTEVFQARPSGAPKYQPADYVLKLVARNCRNAEVALELLRREGRAGYQAKSPHLAPVLSANFHHTPQFLVLPMLGGATLERLLAAGQRPLLPIALWIARQVAEGLAALEQAGWMHGDVKPSNVIVAPSGHVTIIDLGFARRLDEARDLESDFEPLQGTLAYLAPERLVSRMRPDIRSDLYSLGVVLYQMLSGRLPFGSDCAKVLAEQHLKEKPQDLRVLVPHVPMRVARFVHSLLAKDMLRRPHTAADAIRRLASLEIDSFGVRAA